MNEFRIRLAESSDLVAISSIEDDSFQEPYPPFLIERLLHESRQSFFVSTIRSGKVIGYCVSTVNERSAHLLSIAVLRRYRRKGIGRALLQALLTNLEAHDVDQVQLEVKVHNEEAIALYIKLGFARDTIIENYYPDGSAALKMHLSLEKTGLASHLQLEGDDLHEMSFLPAGHQ